MASCINCNSVFKKRTNAYFRFSLDRKVESTGKSAREHLEEVTGSSFTPKKKAQNQFLCPQCWVKLKDTARYKLSMAELLEATSDSSYIARKRTDVQPSPIKRPRFTSTPLTKTKYSKKGPSKWDTIVTAVKARQYGRAISGLYNATAGSKYKFGQVVTRLVRKEIQTLLNMRDDFPLNRDATVQSISNFSWANTINIASVNAPLLLSCLKGAVTSRVNDTFDGVRPRVGAAIALLMNSKSSRKCNFFQKVMSVQLWRGRLKRETLQQVSQLGLCSSYKSTLTAIDHIRSEFDAAAVRCKQYLEATLGDPNVPNEDPEDRDLSATLSMSVPNVDEEIVQDEAEEPEEETILYSDVDPTDDSPVPSEISSYSSDDDDDFPNIEEDMLTSSSSDENVDEMTLSADFSMEPELGETSNVSLSPASPRYDNPGFTLCWDNVGKKVVARHPTETLKNRYLNMALGYMAINRVHSTHLMWEEELAARASDIPLDCFIPKQSDFDQLRFRMNVIVERVVCRHLAWFREKFSDCPMPHIVHDHSTESTRKSVIINLGVFQEDPCSTQGAIGIYEKLQKYVPIVNNKPVKSVVYGDGLSCERGNDAQLARSNGTSPAERLEGLEPAAQEFHKEMLLLQDLYDVFFKASSSSNRGTLCQIKNLLNFRQVKSDIGDSFSHAWELMCTVVETFICLLMMETSSMQGANDKPGNAPDQIEDAPYDVRKQYLETVCNTIVERIWKQLDIDQLRTDVGEGPSVVCCGEDLDVDMIGCEARTSCHRGEFFHYICVDVDPDNITIPWYCSDECRYRAVQPYMYCVCGQDLGRDAPMIGCHLESDCTRREWYHLACVGIDPSQIPKGNWYCCDECRHLSRSKSNRRGPRRSNGDHDLTQEYSLAMVWAGLNLLCRRDAVREADGEAIMSFWRLDLIHFFGNKHPKYTILAHRLLAAVNGWMPDKIKHDLIHNRTVNYSGGIGRNLPLDFMNELLNRLFKDLLETSKGRYTDTTIQRCSQIIGPLGDALDTFFDANVVENEIYRHRRRAQNRDPNVSRLLEFLSPEKLFSNIPGRKHSSFPDFQYDINPRQPGRFAPKIKQLCTRLDRRRSIVRNDQ